MACTISLIDRVFKRGLFLTSQHSEERGIINGNFPILSISLFPSPFQNDKPFHKAWMQERDTFVFLSVNENIQNPPQQLFFFSSIRPDKSFPMC